MGDLYAIAHRGYSSGYDENTEIAMTAAVDVGANAVELDIQRTSDSVLVLMHDTTVDRTTNGTGSVSSLTWSYISTLETTSGEPVPRLQDIFDVLHGADVMILIEIKGSNDLSELLSNLVAQYPLIERQIKIQSFTLSHATDAKAAIPDVDCGLLGGTLGDVTANGLDFHVIDKSGVNATAVSNAHAAGVELFGYTYTSQSEMETHIGYGVDGVICGDVAKLTGAATNAGSTLITPDFTRSGGPRKTDGTVLNSFSGRNPKHLINNYWHDLY